MQRLFEMKRVPRLITAFSLAVFMAGVCFAQTAPEKKSYTFHGKVEAVDESAKSLKVNGEKVGGWMDAMTMNYKVDNAAILKKVKPGDQIMATVYEGDMVLHAVMVMPKEAGDSKSKK
jgi:Cu/Ag efflux protein CusF